MTYRVLITGGSGYLGGTLLNQLSKAALPYEKLYALVRQDSQVQAVQQYGAEGLIFSPDDETAVREMILKHRINVVFYLIDAVKSVQQGHFIAALAALKAETGQDVHFLHTSGAKIFSEHGGAPTDRPLFDDDPQLYEIQRSQRAPLPPMQTAIDTNTKVIDLCEEHDVRAYIFVPCVVYGKGEGFGNPISIQTQAVVKAAKAVGGMYKVQSGNLVWPVCHVVDNATLYISILRAIVTNKNPSSGKQGYYLAASGSVGWDEMYSQMAVALKKRGVISDDSLREADDDTLGKMADALGMPKPMVAVSLSGTCTFSARRGEELGWKPQYSASHILEALDDEVDLILKNI